jgi:hypothetical protein
MQNNRNLTITNLNYAGDTRKVPFDA